MVGDAGGRPNGQISGRSKVLKMLLDEMGGDGIGSWDDSLV